MISNGMLKVCELSIFKLSELPFCLAFKKQLFLLNGKRIENSTARIVLIFTDQPNLVMESGVYPSLYPIVIIKKYLPNSVLKFFTHHRMSATFDIIEEQILIMGKIIC